MTNRRLGTSVTLCLFFLLSGSMASTTHAQTETVTIGRYEPSGNGYVVNNVKIEHGVGISEQGTQYATLQWEMEAVSFDVIGYKYSGAIYNNSSECCRTDWVGPDLEDILQGELRASFQIMYQGNVLKSMNDVVISGPSNAFGTREEVVDAESDVSSDYSITNIRISTHSPSMDRHIGNAIRDLEKKEKAAKKEQAKEAAQADRASEPSSSHSGGFGSGSEEETSGSTASEGEQPQSSFAGTQASTDAGRRAEARRNAEAERRRAAAERERRAEADLERRYQEAQQEHEANMAAIKGAQQGVNAALGACCA